MLEKVDEYILSLFISSPKKIRIFLPEAKLAPGIEHKSKFMMRDDFIHLYSQRIPQSKNLLYALFDMAEILTYFDSLIFDFVSGPFK